MQYRHIRNATALLRYAGTSFLVDPYLAPRGQGPSYSHSDTRSPLVDLPLPVETLVAAADALLLTHMHEDHFDAVARTQLPRDLPILCTLPLVDELKLLGFTQVVPVEPDMVWRGVTLLPTRSQHGPPDVLYRMGHVVGFLLRAPGEPSVHLVGDTILVDHVRADLLAHRPDVLVLNAGGAFSRGVSGPIIMDAPQVVEALQLLPRAQAIAVHLGATDHCRVTRESLRSHVSGVDPSLMDRLHIPQDGETVAIGAIEQWEQTA